MQSDPLPGFELRSKWAERIGKCDATAKRWQDRGTLVVEYFGRDPYVDIEATAARMRGDDKPQRRRG
jgi:hypothetical protein